MVGHEERLMVYDTAPFPASAGRSRAWLLLALLLLVGSPLLEACHDHAPSDVVVECVLCKQAGDTPTLNTAFESNRSHTSCHLTETDAPAVYLAVHTCPLPRGPPFVS